MGYNPDNHSLYIAGHAQQTRLAEYPIVTPSFATTASALPETDDPLQNFASPLSGISNDEGLNRITGLLVHDGALVVNAETWYDADGGNRDTTVVVNDANQLDGSRTGLFELSCRALGAGYMGKIPEQWKRSFGGATHYTGWSSVYSIVSRYSVGPSLYTFDPDDLVFGDVSENPEVSTTAYMTFPYQEGNFLSEGGVGSTSGPNDPADPMWNILSTGVYGFFVPNSDTFAVLGKSGGISSGIGYKITQNNGNLCGGFCPYDSDDDHNYYWLFDVNDILEGGNGNTWEPRPYAYGVWDPPFGDSGDHEIIGATLDDENGVLYMALERAGQVGNYDRPPVIVTFEFDT